ncbi:MAG: hypothetical protein CSA35_06925 [Dethiosulfovibrio peptidovorans]|nr:MAG: hypothetical protein CSA35_06925 [Dethiosulfovibrio peptidovorans]
MAEEVRQQEPEDVGVVEENASKKVPKKQKRFRKLCFLLFFLIPVVMAGALGGLQYSGIWDGRPLLYWVVPKLPYVGEDLSKLLDVPEVYTMTVEERRLYELRQWEKRLTDKELELDRLQASVIALSVDLTSREKNISLIEAKLLSADEQPDDRGLTEDEQAQFQSVVRTYQEISARRAAKIVESLDSNLAVRILRALPEEDRGKILGRMDAPKAAWLTEQLALEKKR